MSFRRPARQPGARILGIGLLILSLIHTPLPQADFHNIRHHDGPGEVCEHHDHLLRWHPGATSADDVAVLHWHWFLPQAGNPDPAPVGAGPAVHAHVADWLAPTWESGPRILPDHSSRLLGRLASCTLTALLPGLPAEAPHPILHGQPRRALAFCATFAPRAPLNSLLQRWVC
jgi:hypothetical protein